ncbi:MAG TPA: hypothetical protein VES19_16955 [Candidatus Limnocylindrales bacterium]|nr:hypothetical protein [Candidatus Limnocylindrales bacterium]
MNRTQRPRRSRLATLALAMVAVAAVSLPAAVPALAAGTGTVKLTPSTQPAAGPGSTFQLQVVSNAGVDTSGIQASVAFDKSVLQITQVARPAGTAWGTAGVFIGTKGDLSVAANMNAQIVDANGNGKLASVAASVVPPAANLVANADQVFLTVTFLVIACPAGATTDVTLPTGAADTVLNDAAGDAVTVSVQAATITPCSSNSGNSTTQIRSSMGAGFLEITVPAAATIPLVRSATNEIQIPVNVYSDGVWTLNVSDAMPAGKLAGDRGKMIDPTGARRLGQPIQARVDEGPLRTLDQPTANTDVLAGSSTASPLVTLLQAVGATDAGGSYSINVLFTATSGF